jgi:beta-lactamase class A
VAPYPASLLKLMVAVGVGLAVDAGRCAWPAALEAMITLSDNDATDTCVALLHRTRHGQSAAPAPDRLGLATLQLTAPRPDGGWRNASGAGVGQIHMTAWDTVRLLWLLDADAPPAPWLPAGTARCCNPATRDHLRAVLARQQLDDILSSGSLRGVPGWVPGLPDAPVFAHKTGSTDNYASDAGIVRTAAPTTSWPCSAAWAGATHPHATLRHDLALPALGAAVHRLMEQPT